MWVCRILHSLSNPAFSILIRCAGGDSQHNLSAAVRWGTRQGASVKMRPSCARTVAQDLGMGRMEKIFPSNPCNFLCDLSSWHQSPNLKPEWLRVDEAPRRKKKSPPQGKEAPRRGQGKKPSAGAGVWGLAPSFHSISEQSLQLIVRERRRSYHVTPQSATQG